MHYCWLRHPAEYKANTISTLFTKINIKLMYTLIQCFDACTFVLLLEYTLNAGVLPVREYLHTVVLLLLLKY